MTQKNKNVEEERDFDLYNPPPHMKKRLATLDNRKVRLRHMLHECTDAEREQRILRLLKETPKQINEHPVVLACKADMLRRATEFTYFRWR